MPPSTTEDGALWRWSARQLTEGIATELIGAREATQSCLDRIEAVNPTLNGRTTIAGPGPDRAGPTGGLWPPRRR